MNGHGLLVLVQVGLAGLLLVLLLVLWRLLGVLRRLRRGTVTFGNAAAGRPAR